jgi:tRNA G26 N,N-dimethylase Trm1
MSSTYKISFRTKLQNSRSFQRLHDCLKQLNVKHWAYDFQELLLTLTSNLSDFNRIQAALTSAGCKCHFVKLENLNEGRTPSLT